MSLKDMKAHMEIGAPMTYEEMMKMKSSETVATDNRSTTEKNPYIFEDKPIGTMRYCIVSMLSNALRQKHDNGNNYIKIRATLQTQKEAVECVPQLDSEKCDMYAYELFKFCAVPCGEAFRSLEEEERDSVLNDAMKAYKKHRVESNVVYEQRKQVMLDDMDRQEKDKERIRAGKLKDSELNSASVAPEAVHSSMNGVERIENGDMKSDRPFNEYNHAVIAIVDLKDISNISSVLTDSNIIKICGVFKSEKDANEHANDLRQRTKYKHIDLYVCCLYEWLMIPPNQEELETVKYTNDKLNDVLGRKNPKSTPTEIYESMTESNDMTVAS
jgi:hypothetical protein